MATGFAAFITSLHRGIEIKAVISGYDRIVKTKGAQLVQRTADLLKGATDQAGAASGLLSKSLSISLLRITNNSTVSGSRVLPRTKSVNLVSAKR